MPSHTQKKAGQGEREPSPFGTAMPGAEMAQSGMGEMDEEGKGWERRSEKEQTSTPCYIPASWLHTQRVTQRPRL